MRPSRAAVKQVHQLEAIAEDINAMKPDIASLKRDVASTKATLQLLAAALEGKAKGYDNVPNKETD